MTAQVLQPKPDVTHPHTGIDRRDRKRLANGLTGLVADSYLLLVKTHGYHWNVVGPLFVSLHELTERQYENLFAAIDELAERIRALGYPAPSSFAQMIAQAQIDEEEESASSAEQMVRSLIGDHEKVVRRLRTTATIAADMQDDVTADLLTKRMDFHEKAVWMLKSLVAQ